MMDIATLSFGIDSSSAARGATALDQMAASARGATTAAAGVTSATDQQAAAIQQLNTTMQQMLGVQQQMLATQQQQSALIDDQVAKIERHAVAVGSLVLAYEGLSAAMSGALNLSGQVASTLAQGAINNPLATAVGFAALGPAGLATGAIVDGISTIKGAIGGLVDQVGHWSTSWQSFSDATVGQTTAMIAAFTGLALSTGIAVTALQQINQIAGSNGQQTFLQLAGAMGRPSAQNANVQGAATALGVNLSNAGPSDTQSKLIEITQALNQVADGPQRTALIQMLAGNADPATLAAIANQKPLSSGDLAYNATYNASNAGLNYARSQWDQIVGGVQPPGLVGVAPRTPYSGAFSPLNWFGAGLGPQSQEVYDQNANTISVNRGIAWSGLNPFSVNFAPFSGSTYSNIVQNGIPFDEKFLQNAAPGIFGAYTAPTASSANNVSVPGSQFSDYQVPKPQPAATPQQVQAGQGFLASVGVISGADQSYEQNLQKANDLLAVGAINVGQYNDAVSKLLDTFSRARDPLSNFTDSLDRANDLAGLQGNSLAIARGLQQAQQLVAADTKDPNAQLTGAQHDTVVSKIQTGLDKQSGLATSQLTTQTSSLQAQAAAALQGQGAVEKLQIAYQAYVQSLQPGAVDQATFAQQKQTQADLQRIAAGNSLVKTDMDQAASSMAVADAYSTSTAAGVAEEATQKSLLLVSQNKIAADQAQTVTQADLINQTASAIASASKQNDALGQQVQAQKLLAEAAGQGTAALQKQQVANQATAAFQQDMAIAQASLNTAKQNGDQATIDSTQRQIDKLAQLKQAYTDNATALQAYQQQQQAEQQLTQGQQTIAQLQMQLGLVQQLPAARQQDLAVMQATLQVQTQLSQADPATKQAIIDQATAIGQLQGAYQEAQQQQQLWTNALKNAANQIDNTIVTSIENMFDPKKATDWGTVVLDVIKKIAAEMLLLTVVKPAMGSLLDALDLGSVAAKLGYSSGGGGGLLSLIGGGGGGGGASQLFVGPDGSISTSPSSSSLIQGPGSPLSLGSSSSSSSLLSDASSLFGLGRNINSLFGSPGDSLFSGEGAFGGSAINDFFGGSGSSLFSGSGAFSASSINQFGASYLGLASGQITPEAMAAAQASPELLVGSGFDGTVDAAGALGATTLSGALPYVGAVITLAQAIASGNTGSIAGTVGGAAIGTIIEPGIGTAIGAALGSIIGGMFAGKISPPGSTANVGLNDDGQLAITGTGHFGGPGQPGAGPAVSLAAGFIDNFNTLATAFNLGLTPGANAALATPFGYQNNRFSGPGGNFGDIQSEETATEETLVGSHSITSNAPGSIGIAENALLGEVGPASFKDLAAALNLAITAANNYDAEIAASGHAISATQQSIAQLNDTFNQDAQSAEQYGLSVGALQQAFANQYNTSIADQIEQIQNSGQAALDAQQRDAQSRIDEATALGADITQVEQLNGLERTQVVEQANQAILASYQQTANSMMSLIAGLTIGSSSPLSPADQLAASATIYNQTKAAALAGDPTALGNYSNVAQSYLSLARSAYATTQPYVDIYNDVLGTATQIANGSANAIAFGQNNLLTTGPNGNLPAFAGGGTFTVGGSGGADSQIVTFKASPWETVTVGNSSSSTNDVASAVMASGGQTWMAVTAGNQTMAMGLSTIATQLAELQKSHSKLSDSMNAVLRRMSSS